MGGAEGAESRLGRRVRATRTLVDYVIDGERCNKVSNGCVTFDDQ